MWWCVCVCFGGGWYLWGRYCAYDCGGLGWWGCVRAFLKVFVLGFEVGAWGGGDKR